MAIVTDNKWKNLKYENEVPARVRKEQFDYLNDDNGGIDGYFKYRGSWYHTEMFMHTGAYGEWHGVHCDSYFSGVLIQLSPDGEQYKVATVIT